MRNQGLHSTLLPSSFVTEPLHARPADLGVAIRQALDEQSHGVIGQTLDDGIHVLSKLPPLETGTPEHGSEALGPLGNGSADQLRPAAGNVAEQSPLPVPSDMGVQPPQPAEYPHRSGFQYDTQHSSHPSPSFTPGWRSTSVACLGSAGSFRRVMHV